MSQIDGADYRTKYHKKIKYNSSVKQAIEHTGLQL